MVPKEKVRFFFLKKKINMLQKKAIFHFVEEKEALIIKIPHFICIFVFRKQKTSPKKKMFEPNTANVYYITNSLFNN